MSRSCSQRPTLAVPVVVAAGCLLLFLVSSAAAQDQRESPERPAPEARSKGFRKAPREPNDERPRPGPPREFGGGGIHPPSRDFGSDGPPGFRGGDFPREMTVNKGYVFIDGEYLAPPYALRATENSLTINGLELTCQPPSRGFFGRGFGGGPGRDRPWGFALSEIYNQLYNDCIVMSFAKQPYVGLDTSTAYELLKSMATKSGREVRQTLVVDRLPGEFDKDVWYQWIDNFDPPDVLRQRAAVMVNNFEQTQRQAEAQIQARRWMEQLSYPLSVGGMVLCVLSIGHLLGGRPHAGQSTRGRDESPAMIRTLNWSLLFAVAFSALDLAWTIVMANADQMVELNPIGRQWISDPRHLAGFKVAVTFAALALLWLLRKHKRAQIAAWWICLILTLVTVRWLTVNSLFTAA
jgi:hypothetical protein